MAAALTDAMRKHAEPDGGRGQAMTAGGRAAVKPASWSSPSAVIDQRTGRTRGGSVAPGFEEVAVEFDRNFAERGEIGAAVAAYWRGEKVVDLWGGHRAPEG